MVAAYALVLHEQLAEHPWLPGAIPHPIWREAQAVLNAPPVPSLSIARNQSWFELGRPLVCVLAISCGFLVGADAGRASAYQGHRLVGRCLRGLWHPFAPFRSDPHFVARKKRPIRNRSPALSLTANSGDLFRLLYRRLVAVALGAGAARDAAWLISRRPLSPRKICGEYVCAGVG